MGTGNPDCCGAITGRQTGLVQSTLGPDGLPVESTPGDPQSLPINYPSNFFPNGSSGSDTSGFVTAVYKGTFVTPAGGSVTFNLGSDDDAWVFLNGKLAVDNGGIQPYGTAPTTISGLNPGTNTVEIFFDDRHTVQAALTFSADVAINSGVPEASTWAMMLCGFTGLGFAAFRQSRKVPVSIV
jgi:fibro-slime domain-containing protein